MWFRVTGDGYAGSSGTYFRTSSLSASFPCSASMRMAIAVNCLLIEPMLNRVSAVIGVPFSTLARPYVLSVVNSPR